MTAPTTIREATPVEAALNRRALAGDTAAFEALFLAHETSLRNYALRLTRNPEDAADITQEAFARVYSRLDTLSARPDANLVGYLFRTVRNLGYDHRSHAAREVLQEELERSLGPDPSLEGAPELAPTIAAQIDEVRAANARLPERHRLVLALREIEGLSYEEIGEMLDLEPTVVGQLLLRARWALRRELRLEQIDRESLDPAVRRRLSDLGRYLDGELDADRTRVLERLLAERPDARRALDAMRDAGQRFRCFAPLAPLAVGVELARAASWGAIGDRREARHLGARVRMRRWLRAGAR